MDPAALDRRLPQTRLLLLVFLVLVSSAGASEASLDRGGLKVMTYNTYVGTDYAGITDPNLPVFLQAATNMILSVRASDPAGRAQAIARQIAVAKPHLVSLQEVGIWSNGPTKDNLTVEFDFLQLLLKALAEQHAKYTPAVSLTTWDATVPSSLGLYGRNTWRVVILARADLDPEEFSLTNAQAAPWSPLNTLSFGLPALNGSPDCPVPLAGTSCVMPFPRGWVSIDGTFHGKRFRYIDAHLESLSNSRNIRQGTELLKGPANTALPVIVAADMNCDLSNPSDPKYVTCTNMLNAGFTDAWTAANPSEPGYTKDLPSMTMRGDYVMVRGFEVKGATLVGEDPSDKTESGLWPSNHAGVVAILQIGRR
jgi:hypothetical protein